LGLVCIPLLLGLVLCNCADKPPNPVDAVTTLCAGSWVASPDSRGPSPPPGFEHLRIAITSCSAASATAAGTVSWNGHEWPMSCGVSRKDLSPFCKYAAGHPFSTSPDPEGFSFEMLVGEGSFESNRSIDELYINFSPHSSRPIRSFEQDLVKYERAE